MHHSDPALLFHHGNALAARGLAAEAAEAFQRAALAAPDVADIHFNLGNALVDAGRPMQAAEAYLACLRRAPGFGPGWLNLAETLRSLGALTDARAMAEQALRLMPNDSKPLICFGNVLFDTGAFAGAAALYTRAIGLAPGLAGGHGNLGNALLALGRLDESLAAHARAIALAPDDPELRFGRAVTLLTAGQFAEGWAEYEWRWRRPGRADRGFGPAWQGDPIAGRTILLHAEQGQGDALQFLRYVPLVAARGARVVLEVPASLRRLAAGLAGVDALVTRGEPLPAFDVHCPLLSLPRAFGTTLESIPAPVRYLAADPGIWHARLPATGRRRIGLCWAGGPQDGARAGFLADHSRAIPPAVLAPLAGLDGVDLVSLQHAPIEKPPFALFDPMAEMRDFADTAALIANLDLVISVDTAVAHLAGALGKPVWLLVRSDPCWRWLHGRDDSPWYPTMRIFRQASRGDWAPVVARVTAALAEDLPLG